VTVEVAMSRIQPDPPYRRIVSDIRGRIVAGDLGVGDRVPSARQITQEWGVAIATATKVLATLRQEGLVRVMPGVGTVVADRSAGPDAGRAGGPDAGRAGGPDAGRQRARGARPAAASRDRAAPEAGLTGDGGLVRDGGLTREQIARTAIALADAEGASALSMRRVAAALGVATMSLYRYVRGRDDLIVLMVEVLFEEQAVPTPPPRQWRAAIEAIARSQWALYRRHPWLARFISVTRPLPVPSAMEHTEQTMRAFDGLGFDASTTMHIAIVLAAFVSGIAAHLEAEAEARQHTGVTSDEWMNGQGVVFQSIVASGRFPRISQITGSPDFDLPLDDLFEFGLTTMIDGLAARIARQRP
jgi:AcrR family transcriptional regulator